MILLMTRKIKPTILIDSREKLSWEFPGFTVKRTCLQTYGCDYTIRGYGKYIGVERKSIPDLVTCLRKPDFGERQVARIASKEYGCIIVEGDPRNADCMKKKIMGSDEVMIACIDLMIQYNVTFLFAGDRKLAALACCEYLLMAKKSLDSR